MQDNISTIYDIKIKNRGRKKILSQEDGDKIIKKVKEDRYLTCR